MPGYNIVDSPIDYLYQNLLGRGADDAGRAYYQGELDNGLALPDIYGQIAQSNEGKAYRQNGAPAPAATPVGSGSAGGSGSSNPYLADQANAIRGQHSQLLNDYNQQINSNANAVGGFGGSRQGVEQGVAAGRAATGLDSALAGLYGNAYEGDQNRALGQYGMDQSFYTSQRGQDLQTAGLGASLYGMGQQGEWDPYNQFNKLLGTYSGQGTTTASSSQGGGGLGFLGGALGGAQLSKSYFNPYG